MIPEFIVNDKILLSHNTKTNFSVVFSFTNTNFLALFPIVFWWHNIKASEINIFLLCVPSKTDILREWVAIVCLKG